MGAARQVACRTGWHRLCRAGHRAGSDVGQDQRAPLLTALERARATAYPAGEYVGQESFMRAGEVRKLAHQARVGPGVSVLDLCCGVAGPGRMITAESGCHYLGVDHSASALATAQQLAGIVEPLGGYYVDPHDAPAVESAFRTEPASSLRPS